MGRIASGHADRARVAGVVGDEARLPGDRLDDGDPMREREIGERLLRERVVDAASRDDERRVRRGQQARRLRDALATSPRTRHGMHGGLEEADGDVERLGLHVLGQTEEHRAAVARVEQDGERVGEALQ